MLYFEGPWNNICTLSNVMNHIPYGILYDRYIGVLCFIFHVLQLPPIGLTLGKDRMGMMTLDLKSSSINNLYILGLVLQVHCIIHNMPYGIICHLIFLMTILIPIYL